MVKLNKNKVFLNSNEDFSQFKKKRKFYILNAALLLENNLVEKKINTPGIDSENPLLYHRYVDSYRVC